jgi:hypothetical protein
MRTFNVIIGSIASGIYMGCAFTGVVSGYEADVSGYRGTENDRRLWIKVDADLVCGADHPYHPGYVRRTAGEAIIASVTARGTMRGVVEDSKFEKLLIDGVLVHESWE